MRHARQPLSKPGFREQENAGADSAAPANSSVDCLSQSETRPGGRVVDPGRARHDQGIELKGVRRQSSARVQAKTTQDTSIAPTCLDQISTWVRSSAPW